MSQGFDLEKALRILKTKKISKEAVAKVTGVSPGYISKMLSGTKPLTQSFLDVFLKEYSSELEGEVLLEVSQKQLLIGQLSLEAKVEILTALNLGLIAALNEKNKGEANLNEYLSRDISAMLQQFDEFVEGKALDLLNSRQ